MAKHTRSVTTEKQQTKTSNIILIILGVFILAFTTVCMWYFYLFQSVPDILITAVFGAVFGEVSILGWIKTVKTKFDKREDNNNEL